MPIFVFNPKNRASEHDFDKIIEKYPDINLVISLGGDGTILGAFEKYKDLPILPIKSSNVCSRCFPIDDLESIVESIKKGIIKPTQHHSLQATFNHTAITALNEINIHSKNPQSAIRYRYYHHQYNSPTIIADGIVFSTPFGSTGYFRSITNTTFEQGIGIGINNPTVHQYHQIVDINTNIDVTIERGPALLMADNQPRIITLNENDQVNIKLSTITANIFTPI